MRVSFRSSHVEGDYSGGRLELLVDSEGVSNQASIIHSIWFTVPADFHTHNDSVAAALMTLVGRRFQDVTLNFPISRYCAEVLAWYYDLAHIGPVDDGLEPRRPGRFLALNFSGGLDSTAMWVLLRELAGVQFKVVTSEYEGFKLDRPGYSPYQRDVSTETNLRRLRYDRHGRFHCAAPLLFADYADLWGVASGHMLNHRPNSFESLVDGQAPMFLTQDATYNAGGLAEVHIARCLNEAGLMMLLANHAPERIAAALDGSAFAGDRKRALKSLTLKYFFDVAEKPVPACLRSINMPGPGVGRTTAMGIGLRLLWVVKRLTPDVIARIEPNVFESDLSLIEHVSADFLERYNTNISQLIPAPLRPRVLHGLHTGGIYPYSERDHAELDTTRTYMASVGLNIVAPTLRRDSPPPACWSPSAFDASRLHL